MRIMMIEPGYFLPDEIKAREHYAKSICSVDTHLQLIIPEAEKSTPKDLSMLNFFLPGIVQKTREAERDGYDAVVVDCFSDLGVEASKSVVNIPVVGPCESSLHIACLLADKFGWIAPMDESISASWRQAVAYRMADRINLIGGINVPLNSNAPVLGYRNKGSELEAQITKVAGRMLHSGAQLILIGCTAMLPALGIGSAIKLSKKLNVPLIDPLGIALKTAEGLVNLRLSQSKIAFPNCVIDSNS